MVQFIDGGGVLVAICEIVRDKCQKGTSPGKRGRLVTRAYLPWWKSEPNFENRLTAIFSLSRDKSLVITQHDNADNGPPLKNIQSYTFVKTMNGCHCSWIGEAHLHFGSLGKMALAV